MKMKVRIIVVSLLFVCAFIMLSLKKYDDVNKMFVYKVDKQNGEVIITEYIGDESVEKQYEKGKNEQVVYLDKIEIPSTIKGYPVTTIDDRAFEWAKVKIIILPDTVTTIGDSAFAHCENLESIEGMDNVQMVGNYAFLQCEKLQSLYVPNLKQVGELSFAGCDGMKEINIPEEMETIPKGMCKGMNSLEEVDIPYGVTTIDSTAFASCSNLKKIYIPSSVTNIKESSFRDIEDQITICATKGSYAEEYAATNEIKFELLPEE